MTESGPPSAPALCVADDATFWPWRASPAIGTWADREETVVVLPIAGFCDWGLGHPLDAEETVLAHVLREACQIAPAGRKPLVVPPLRFAFGTRPACAFGVDAPTAQAFITEVAASVGASGFRKITLLNASPWNEELCGAVARDLRVERGLHLFTIHLSALGLDFHPLRSSSRRSLQTLLTALYGRAPEDASPGSARQGLWGEEPVAPLAGAPETLAAADAQAPAILSDAAAKLTLLLSAIRGQPALKGSPLP